MMSRIETKHPKRMFPALDGNDWLVDGGHARAIARRMAFEGAAALARTLEPGSPCLGDLVDRDACPLARCHTWTVRPVRRPIVA